MAFEPVDRRHRGGLHQLGGLLDQLGTHRLGSTCPATRATASTCPAATVPAASASCSSGISAHNWPRAAIVFASRDERRPPPDTTVGSGLAAARVASNASSQQRTCADWEASSAISVRVHPAGSAAVNVVTSPTIGCGFIPHPIKRMFGCQREVLRTSRKQAQRTRQPTRPPPSSRASSTTVPQHRGERVRATSSEQAVARAVGAVAEGGELLPHHRRRRRRRSRPTCRSRSRCRR